jgi:hypothetical protein
MFYLGREKLFLRSQALLLFLCLGLPLVDNRVFGFAEQQVELSVGQEKSKEFYFERRVELQSETERTYEVDLGEVPQNRSLHLRIDLFNASGSERTFDVVASCGCAKLEPSHLVVKNGQSIDLKTVLKTAGESALGFVIAFVEPSKAFSFRVNVKGQVRHEMETVPASVKLKASEPLVFDIKVRPRFKELGISSLSCLSDRFGSGKFEQDVSGVWHVKFDAAGLSPPQGAIDDSFVLSGALSDGSRCDIRVPVAYTDRSKVFPSPLVFRDVNSKPVLVFIVSGALVQQSGLQFKIGQTGLFGEPIVPKSMRRRSEQSAVVELPVARELYEKISRSEESWFLEVSDANTHGVELTVPIRGPIDSDIGVSNAK